MTSTSETAFLVGSVRSGTTLLRLLLDRHPEIYWFGEFEYPVRFLEDEGWPDLETYWRELEVDRPFVRDRVDVDRSLNYVALARSFLDQHRERVPNHRIIGCTVHSRIDRLPEIWPEARYIHLLRDPRDVARSVVGMGWAGHPAHGVETWLRAEARWDRLRSRLPDDAWVEVRYEDLVRHTKLVMSRLCEFLGVAMDERMLAPDPDATYGSPDASLAEQWRRKMTERDVRRVEERVGDRLQERGYEPSGFPALSSSSFERAWVGAANRSGKARHAIRKYGFKLWAEASGRRPDRYPGMAQGRPAPRQRGEPPQAPVGGRTQGARPRPFTSWGRSPRARAAR